MDLGEECDGEESAPEHFTCTEGCSLEYVPYCDDGICNGLETCSSCPGDCGACPYCGDGVVNQGSEECDRDDGVPEHYTCTEGCSLEYVPYCGDQSCDSNETCSSCPGDCGNCPYCGDGAVNQIEEECDDGNNESDDGCSSVCLIEPAPWAMFVMPDTQYYSYPSIPERNDHMRRVTQWICENQHGWIEPSTGKEMDILMVLHLGDIVQQGESMAQWEVMDSAFDLLDNCSEGVVPYMLTVGNHDYNSYISYNPILGWETYFNTSRFSAHQCTSTPCEADKWFIGGSPPIQINSRGSCNPLCGPSEELPGRFRAATIIDPNNQRYLFIGMEFMYTDLERNWSYSILNNYSGVPTILFKHKMFVGYGPDNLNVDTTKEIWQNFIDPYSQIIQTWNGHIAGESDNVSNTSRGVTVISNLRDYQSVNSYGDGWNAIAVFDPEEEEVRVRSYRINNSDPLEIAEMDYGMLERAYNYSFPKTR
jgi:cysteine-rich repeat protein